MPQETELWRLSAVKSMQTLIQLSMPCVHERISSTVGEVGLEVILNCSLYSIFTNASKRKANSKRWLWWGLRWRWLQWRWAKDCGLGCFSPVQWLDERSKASWNYIRFGCDFIKDSGKILFSQVGVIIKKGKPIMERLCFAVVQCCQPLLLFAAC